MQKITPFLWFSTEAEEAMHFYVSVFSDFGSDAHIESVKRYPDGPLEGPMKGMEGKVLTGVFTLAGQRFMALDGGPLFKPTEAVSLYIDCETQDEVDHYWNRLAEGGDPKAQQCGWLKDKYGFSWQIIPRRLSELLSGPDSAKSSRVMQAMMGMQKIVIADLEKAYAEET